MAAPKRSQAPTPAPNEPDPAQNPLIGPVIRLNGVLASFVEQRLRTVAPTMRSFRVGVAAFLDHTEPGFCLVTTHLCVGETVPTHLLWPVEAIKGGIGQIRITAPAQHPTIDSNAISTTAQGTALLKALAARSAAQLQRATPGLAPTTPAQWEGARPGSALPRRGSHADPTRGRFIGHREG